MLVVSPHDARQDTNASSMSAHSMAPGITTYYILMLAVSSNFEPNDMPPILKILIRCLHIASTRLFEYLCARCKTGTHNALVSEICPLNRA